MSESRTGTEVDKLVRVLEEFEHQEIAAAVQRLGLRFRRRFPTLLVVPPSAVSTTEVSRAGGARLAVEHAYAPPHDVAVYTKNEGDHDVEVRLEDGAGVTGRLLVPPGFGASLIVADVALIRIDGLEVSCADCRFTYRIDSLHGCDGGMTQIDPPSLELDAGPADTTIDSVVDDLAGIVVLC